MRKDHTKRGTYSAEHIPLGFNNANSFKKVKNNNYLGQPNSTQTKYLNPSSSNNKLVRKKSEKSINNNSAVD
jgi:hypothetical protein